MKRKTIRSELRSYARKIMDILKPDRLDVKMRRVSGEEYGRELKILGGKSSYVTRHFGSALPYRAAFDNAMIILGNRFGDYRENVHGHFMERLFREPLWKNGGEWISEVSGFYSSGTGRITAFGTAGTVPKRIAARHEQFTIAVDSKTGCIMTVKGRENLFLRCLDGMQVTEPLKGKYRNSV